MWHCCCCWPCCWHHQFASHNRMRIRNRSGFLPVGSLAVDTLPMITVHIAIQVACWGGDTIPLMIPLSNIDTKGKPITHTAIPITTIQVVHGIIQSRTITMAATGDIDDHLEDGDPLNSGRLCFSPTKLHWMHLLSHIQKRPQATYPWPPSGQGWHLTLKQLVFLEAILNRPASQSAIGLHWADHPDALRRDQKR